MAGSGWADGGRKLFGDVADALGPNTAVPRAFHHTVDIRRQRSILSSLCDHGCSSRYLVLQAYKLRY